jgi:O-antigen/teichoic acid export membrane protein
MNRRRESLLTLRRVSGTAVRLRVGRALAVGHAEIRHPLLRTAYSLAANSVLNATLGLVFWVAAARLYPSGSIGRDSALVAAMMQVSTIAQLNMGNALVRFMPGNARAARLLVGAYSLSACAAFVLAVTFVAVAPGFIDTLAFLHHQSGLGASFVVAVILWGVFALQDAALIATRNAPWVPVENAAFGIFRLAALALLFVGDSSHGVFLAWLASAFVVTVPVNVLLFRRFLPRYIGRHGVTTRLPFSPRRLLGFLALDYAGSVFVQMALALLPLIVLALFGSRVGAHFFIPFAIVLALDALFFSVATSLVAEGSLSPRRLPVLVGVMLRRGVLLAVPAVGLIATFAHFVLVPFGAEYVRESTSLLRVLVVASLFRGLVALGSAVWRVTGHTGRIAVLDGFLLGSAVAGSILLGKRYGVEGVAWAWLATSAATGCAVLPTLMRYYRLSSTE